MVRLVASARHATQRTGTLNNCAKKFILRIAFHQTWAISKFLLGNQVILRTARVLIRRCEWG